jgi:hypothetical protein
VPQSTSARLFVLSCSSFRPQPQVQRPHFYNCKPAIIFPAEIELHHASETKSLDDARARRCNAVAAREQAAAALSQVEEELTRVEAGLAGAARPYLQLIFCLKLVSEVKAAAEAARSGVVKVRESAPCFATAFLLK